MGKFVKAAGITSAAVLVAAVPAAAAHPRHHGGSKQHVLRLFAHTAQEEFLDLGAPGASLGDRDVFSHDVRRRPGGRVIGQDGGECTIVRIDEEFYDETLQCVVTLRLPGGQLTTQGLARFPGGMPPDRFTVAITGGTGRFLGASGRVVVHTLSDTRFRYVVRWRR